MTERLDGSIRVMVIFPNLSPSRTAGRYPASGSGHSFSTDMICMPARREGRVFVDCLLFPGRDLAVVPASGHALFTGFIQAPDGFPVRASSFRMGVTEGGDAPSFSMVREYVSFLIPSVRLCFRDHGRKLLHVCLSAETGGAPDRCSARSRSWAWNTRSAFSSGRCDSKACIWQGL